MLLRSSCSRLLPLRRGAVRRNCSNSSSSNNNSSCSSNNNSSCKSGGGCPKTKEALERDVITERNIIVGAAAGAVFCVAARLKRDTDDKYRRISSSGNDFFWSATGGALVGAMIGTIWLPAPVISSVVATAMALQWLDEFPDIVKIVHFLRHGDVK